MNVSSFLARGLLLAGLFAGAPGAVSAADEIGLSKDGSTWSTTLADPLFDPAFRWVPGDDETSSFFVRNQGPSAAALTISVRSMDTDQLLSNADIELHARSDGGPWIELSNGAPTTALTDSAISQGGTVRIHVRARFDPASNNPSENKSLPLRFVITLTDAAGAVENPDDPDDDNDDSDDDDGDGKGRDGDLPGTGSELGPAPLWAAAILIGGGLALVRSSRRSEQTNV